MKKSGFTLIEILISILILGIITSAVFSSFAFCMKLFKSIDTKTYLQLYADTAINDFKCKNTSEIRKLYDTGVKNSHGLAGQFIFFDNMSELKEGLSALSFNTEINSGDFIEAKGKNSSKKFAAFCGILNLSNFGSGFKSYTFSVKIFDNNSNTLNGVENERDFIIPD